MARKKKTEEDVDKTVYDSEDVEEMLEDDELGSSDAGFMEGYNQKQSKEGKDAKKIVKDK
ncbi:MAG: hypothetical protein HYW50_02970 [Candidatus Diapherotrites archaeon]|nr:hypothetical protein [Candidatus Diapherotrites archaeon]